MSLYIPPFDSIVDLHDVVLDMTGGKAGILVENDIRRAAERPLTYTNYVPEYDEDTICALLIDSIARYHGFNDGNKRTALMTAFFTYRLNDVHFRADLIMNQHFDALVMWVVKEKPEVPEIEKRLKDLRTQFEIETKESWLDMIVSFITMRKLKDNKSKKA